MANSDTQTFSTFNFDNIWARATAIGSAGILLAITVCISIFGFVFFLREEQIQNQNSIQEVVFTANNGEEFSITAEIADTPIKRAQGLMNRTSLCLDCGMLFIFPTEREVSFWMKDTLIPLDIIFVDRNLQVVKIYEDTEPNQTEELYPSGSMIKYVLETNAGWTERSGLEEADFIRLR